MSHSKLLVALLPTGSLLVVLVAGYLALQTEGMLNGYLFDLSGTPATSIAKRFPWELQVAIVLMGFAAVVAYRRFTADRTAKVVVLSALILAAVLSAALYETIHTTRTSLFAMALVNGGTSPLTLGFIAGVASDVIHSKRVVERDAA